LAQALTALPEIKDNNLLVGMNTADDAGIYKLSDELALVYTIDILTPVVDDPFVFGMIAAANSVSDVYAMGGEPKLALNIIGFPANDDPKILGEILRGGQEKAKEAGVTIAGGHTFNSDEIKFGLSVVGYIHPDKIITNAGAKPDDVIILTKPIGVGSIIQSLLLGRDQGINFESAIKAMSTLNKEASLTMREVGVEAATDITGYGLIGHLVEMAEASKVGIELWASKIPIHNGAIDILKNGIFEPGITMNQNSFSQKVDIKDVDKNISSILFGSETSGGLAIVLPEKKVNDFIEKYKQPVPIIGRITKENPGRLKILT
jgi:selenide,water dikinase